MYSSPLSWSRIEEHPMLQSPSLLQFYYIKKIISDGDDVWFVLNIS